MQYNDIVVVISLVLVGAFLLIARHAKKTKECKAHAVQKSNTGNMQIKPFPMSSPHEHMRQIVRPIQNYEPSKPKELVVSSFTPNRQQPRVRPMRQFEPASNNVREMLNSATIIDGDKPCDLFPEANACKNLPDDWKDMFSHAENTLASENFVEPSYEYAIGTLNVPKKWLTLDLRGAPEVPQYDNLTPFNNSPISNLDLSEASTRRAGEL